LTLDELYWQTRPLTRSKIGEGNPRFQRDFFRSLTDCSISR
jgi:hypothetical protein